MRGFLVPVVGAFLFAGCAQRHGTVLGQAPRATVLSIASVRSAGLAAPITVRGTMLEK